MNSEEEFNKCLRTEARAGFGYRRASTSTESWALRAESHARKLVLQFFLFGGVVRDSKPVRQRKEALFFSFFGFQTRLNEIHQSTVHFTPLLDREINKLSELFVLQWASTIWALVLRAVAMWRRRGGRWRRCE